MQAIYAGPTGEPWKKSRIQIYGWENISFNLSTSRDTSRGPNANFPLIYDLRPNRIEQNQLAPNNLMASHSLLYGFDNYTQTGIFTTTKLNDQWTLQAGISSGTDVALWQDDPGNQPTGPVMIQWTSPSQMDSVYFGDNAFNNGEFSYNNFRQIVAPWTHKFNDRIRPRKFPFKAVHFPSAKVTPPNGPS